MYCAQCQYNPEARTREKFYTVWPRTVSCIHRTPISDIYLREASYNNDY